MCQKYTVQNVIDSMVHMSGVSKVHHMESNTFNGIHVWGVKKEINTCTILTLFKVTFHTNLYVFTWNKIFECFTHSGKYISPVTFHQDLCWECVQVKFQHGQLCSCTMFWWQLTSQNISELHLRDAVHKLGKFCELAVS